MFIFKRFLLQLVFQKFKNIKENRVRNNIKKKMQSKYRAAGVFLYKVGDDGVISVLMALEFGKKDELTLSLLGGKMERGDIDAADTAAREFDEESGGILRCLCFKPLLSSS